MPVFSLLTLVLALAVLIWSADALVDGASGVARRHAIPPVIVGIVLIGFGTSLPELVVSAAAALKGEASIAVGNAVGSNIANIALVLGAGAAMAGLTATGATLRLRMPITLAAAALPGFLLFDGALSRLDGIVLLAGFAAAITAFLLIKTDDDETDDGPVGSARRDHIKIVAGLVLITLSAEAAVSAAITIATALNIDKLIIGLTALAIGTSLPELAATIAAALRKRHGLALGNVLGSNVFNALAVIGIPALAHPAVLPPELFRRDYLLMLVLTLALPPLFARRRMGRLAGLALLAVFCGYLITLVAAARA